MDGGNPGVRFSAREIEVLEALSDGLPNAEIAKRLCLSAHTVEAHNRRLFRKLGARNRLQAVECARRRGLLGRSSVAPALPEIEPSVAHDLTNHLTVLLAYAELIADAQDLPDEVRDYARESLQSSLAVTRWLHVRLGDGCMGAACSDDAPDNQQPS